MSWSIQFQADLQAQTLDPVFVLEIMKWGGTPGMQFFAASSGDYGYPEIIGAEISLSGSSIAPIDWRYTHGACSIQIVGDSITELAMYAQRGALAILKMGFPGYSLAELEPIFVGRVNTITGRGPNWTLELWDGTSILTSRLITGYTGVYRQNEMNLFYNVGDSTTLTSTYNVGDTELDLTDASAMEESTLSGKYSAVYVDPGGGADPFFLTYDGTTGNQLQNVTTVDVLGTTRVTASTGGSTVSNVAYLRGTPAEIFIRILVSGSGTSTAYDVYPETWGYGLPLDLVDWADCIGTLVAMQARLGAGPTYEIAYPQSDQITDSWTWLSEWFRGLGLIPIQRQGLITLRPIQDPSDPAISSGITITDLDIESVDEWVCYNPDVPAEHVQARVFIKDPTSPFSTVSRVTPMIIPKTLPVEDRVDYNNSDKFASFATSVCGELRDRLGPWGTGRGPGTATGSGLPEEVSITCVGLRLAGLSVLDVVHLTTDELRGGRLASTQDGWTDQPCMVLRCSPDFISGRVALTLAAIDPL